MLIYLDRMPFLIGKFEKVVEQIFAYSMKKSSSRIIFPTTLHELALSKEKQSWLYYHKVDLCTCDSMFLTYFLRSKTHRTIDRVYGPELILAILDKNAKSKFSQKNLFLAPDKVTMLKMSTFIANQYPTLPAKFAFLPKGLNQKQEFNYLEKIEFSGPGIVWIGIGSPKQIKLANWFKANYKKVDVYCVGAAFDFLTKQQKQAPKWMQKNGLEWFFRLVTEPKRLWRRYLITIPKYLFSLLLERIKKKNS